MNSFMMLSSAAFELPVVLAKADEANSDGINNGAKKMKASAIPLYPEPVSWEYTPKPPNKLEELVKTTRIQATNIKAEYQPIIDNIIHVAETGKAHTSQAVWRVRNDTTTRVGAMALGGMVTGLIAARRRGLFNKVSSLLIGLGGTGMLCYPDQTKILVNDTGKLALKNARIAYHFIVGARPAIPNENGKPFDRVVGMTTEIGKWGFSLFRKINPINAEHEAITPRPETSDSDKEVPALSETPIHEDALASEITTKPTPSTQTNEDVNVLAKESSTLELHQTPKKDNEPPQADTSNSTTSPENVPSEQKVIIEDEIRASEEDGSLKFKESKNGEEPAPIAAVAYEGDLGQGTLEDKELYTTRE
ncbi:putative MICOS complex subunit [Daphnia magna]|uniref:MICOS complex subunit n=1 Tax=Daphnia magna TaxID=35525 RepID=A0A0P5Z6A7_9CRUS|nr:putative MICOS complex subunit [Daphnia magna]